MEHDFQRPSKGYVFLFLLLVSTSICLASTRDSDLKILSSSPNHLLVQFTPSNWRAEERKIDGLTFHLYMFDRADLLGEAGSPQIPTRMATIGVPLTGDVSFQVIDAEFQTAQNIRLLPNPQVSREDLGYRTVYQVDEEIYQSRDILPASIVSMAEPSWFRSQRVVQLRIQPLQFLPAERTIRQYRRILVQINFSGQQANSTQVTKPAADESWYADLLLNYRQAREWRQPVTRPLQRATHRTFAGDNWYKITIHGDGKGGKEGLYKIDGATLAKAGVPTASIDPRTLQMFNNGGRELPQEVSTSRPDSLIEIAIAVVGGDDGRLDADDYLLFYGTSLEGSYFDARNKKFRHYIHHYSFDNVYWLTYGLKPGKRIESKNSLSNSGLEQEKSFRDLAFLEEERTNIYHSGIDWFGFELAAEKNSYTYTFSLPGAIPQDSAEFHFRFSAATTGSHRYKMYANGNAIGEATHNGGYKQYVLKDASFSAKGVLLDGTNTVRIDYSSNSDIAFVYVDYIEVEYGRGFHAVGDQLLFNAPVRGGAALYKVDGFSRNDVEIYDVTTYSAVKKFAGSTAANGAIVFADDTDPISSKRYLAVTPTAYKAVTSIQKHTNSDLRRARTADYVIITHENFYQQAMALESLHENWNSEARLETEVVKISDVINEFGWGIVDPSAIRDFLVYAQNNWGNPRYVLLMGDGHYDYKNLRGNDTPNFIPPWESNDSYEESTRTSDDWFTYTRGRASGMQMAIGRLPVQTPDEAENVVEKIIQYVTQPDFGEWRKTITIVGDDELVTGGAGNETIHAQQAEGLAEQHVSALFDVKKIYLMDYPAVRTASVSGVTKPAATEALLDQINRGTLILNFIGHGNDELWTHERVLNGPTDFERIQNKNHFALWIAATCEFALWDQPDKQSLAERILTARGRGAMGIVSSARLAYSSPNVTFNYALFDELFSNFASSGLTARIGDANMLAKRRSGDATNSEKFNVFGDPAVRLGAPRYRAVIDSTEPDSIQALRKVRISGHIEKGQKLWQDFEGKVLLRVVDSRKQKTYETSYGSTVQYMLEGNTLFRGVAAATAGQFSVEFIVPKDISYGGVDGRVSLYFWNDKEDGTGNRENLIVGGTAVNLVDHDGPQIEVDFGRPNFAPGDYTSSNPVLHVEISDSLSGVNIAGDIGHQIQMVLDKNENNAKDITEFFEYDQGSYTKGSLKYPMYQVSEGPHDLQIKAWDNSNNSSMVETNFVVVADSVLRIRNVLNYPNPMTESTTFSFELSQDAEVSLKIYSVAGRLLRKFALIHGEIGFNVFPEQWDGTDQDGDKLANGVYLYQVRAKANNGEKNLEAEQIGKLIIAR